MFYCYIHFLSLEELKRRLADVVFFPSSTPTAKFQCSRHFQERFFTRLSCEKKGLGGGVRLKSTTIWAKLFQLPHSSHQFRWALLTNVNSIGIKLRWHTDSGLVVYKRKKAQVWMSFKKTLPGTQ